jgi:hypothetical protein
MQIYSPTELGSLVRRNGLDLVRQCGADGSRLTANTERILTIARKRQR